MSDEDFYSDEEEDSSDEAELERAALDSGKQERRPPIYNTDAIHDKLEDIGWTMEVDWSEHQAITSAEPTKVEDIDDDLERELAFYNQALGAAQQAITKLQELGTPWLRPPDYYAEMVKSDVHMNKVKEQLMFQQKQIEEQEERRKQRESKYFAKKMQLEKERERNAEKKRQIEAVSKLRAQRAKQGFKGELDFDAELDNLDKPQGFRASKAGDRFQPGSKQVGKKRQVKDAKFGFGGPKRLHKQNDAASAASVDAYQAHKGKGKGKGDGFKAKGGVSKKKGGKQQRPGKARRQAMKAGKK